jgi:hypothetical protein
LEATASHWRSRYGSSAPVDRSGDDGATPTSSGAAGMPCYDLSDGDGSGGDWVQRGRWDYVVGLVGKPSAGEEGTQNFTGAGAHTFASYFCIILLHHTFASYFCIILLHRHQLMLLVNGFCM